jgi:hypothetical protein
MNDGSDLDLRLPQPDDRPFIEAHPLRGAYVARNTDERLYRLINGFRNGADLLVERAMEEPHFQSNLVYPIIFNYRQSLELHLKYLLMAYGPLTEATPDFRSHDLKKLWSKYRHVVESLDPGLSDGDTEAINAAEACIAEFGQVDPGSDAFRFAHDSKGHPIQLQINNVDLSNLREVMASIHNLLECIDLQLHHGCGITRCAY